MRIIFSSGERRKLTNCYGGCVRAYFWPSSALLEAASPHWSGQGSFLLCTADSWAALAQAGASPLCVRERIPFTTLLRRWIQNRCWEQTGNWLAPIESFWKPRCAAAHEASLRRSGRQESNPKTTS